MSEPDHDEIYQRGTHAPAGGLVKGGAVLAAGGLALFALLLFGDDPGRAWRTCHINFLYFTGIALGGILFVAIQKVTNARWSGSIIRIAEAGVAFLPIAKTIVVVSLLIMAFWKALLVALYYMHMKWEPTRLRIVALAPLPAVAIMIVVILMEYV